MSIKLIDLVDCDDDNDENNVTGCGTRHEPNCDRIPRTAVFGVI